MSEPEPAIIQGDHPFKVEAVLSKTGGVNALAKHAPDLQKAQDIGLDHRASIPPDALDSDHRVHLDSQSSGDSPAQGPLLQEQYDTQHREQFTDPSRRIQTNQRIKIQPSDSVQTAFGESPGDATPQKKHAASTHQHAPSASQGPLTEGPAHRQDFSRRIEQIKHTNESVGKDLEALEKLSQTPPSLKPGD